MPTIRDIADEVNSHPRTIQRKVKKFNSDNGTSFDSGVNALIENDELLKFIHLKSKTRVINGVKNESGVKAIGVGLNIKSKAVQSGAKKKKVAKEALKSVEEFDPQEINYKLEKANHVLIAFEKEIEEKDKVIEELVYNSQKPDSKNWRDIVAEFLTMLPLPMLGLAASYGVFLFAYQFAPFWVAVIEAAAFEVIYISLAAAKKMFKPQRDKAIRVSKGAVAVSVIYNIIAGYVHFDAEFVSNSHWFIFLILAIVHGSPMAILAYYVADLRFHTKEK